MEESTKIVNFMSPGAGVLVVGHCYICHKVRKQYFFKNLLLYSLEWIRKTECKVMMTKEGSTKIEKFCDPLGKGSCARAWQYKS